MHARAGAITFLVIDPEKYNCSGLLKLHDPYDHYIYHFQELNLWFIGPQPGQNFGYLVHINGFQTCPEDLERNNWFYLGKHKTWYSDDLSITVICN